MKVASHNRVPKRMMYSYAEACELLGGIGKTTLRRLISEGRLRVIRHGRASAYVPHEEIERYVRENVDITVAAEPAPMPGQIPRPVYITRGRR